MTVQWDDAELLDVFLEEAGENLAAIEEGLLALEQRPDDAGRIDEIFRAAHTLKGGAATLSLTTLCDAADAVEDLFAAIREKRVSVTPAVAGVLLHGVDLLRVLLPVAPGARRAPLPAGPHGVGASPVGAHGVRPLIDAQRSLCDELRRLAAQESQGEPAPRLKGESGTAPPQASRPATSLRVSTQKLDRLLDLTSQAKVARAWLRDSMPLEAATPDIIEREQRLQAMELELQELIMSARLVPLEPLFRQYIRTVHDAAQACGKNVRLLIDAGDVELDTRLVESIKDPLMHIVRNAVDHGIEAPTHRQCKRELGTIRLRARAESPAVVIEVSDDGRGFERDRILARAIELGLAARGADLTDDEVYDFVFRPGFSTALSVNAISGRGVGLDVVRKNISALRGSVRIENHPGLGATISIRLPLTLAVIAAVPVRVGGETYALPLESVVECVDLPGGAGGAVDVRGEMLAALSLAEVFAVPAGPPARQVAVVVRYSGGKAAFVVDAISASIHAVIKPLGKFFAAFPFIAGSTVLNNGRIAFILDADGVMSEMARRRTVASA